MKISCAQVHVKVLDKNDVAPSWPDGPWNFQVSEDTPLNTLITTLKAHDPDTIGSLRYSLLPSSAGNAKDSSNNLFKLHSVTGQLRYDIYKYFVIFLFFLP